MNLIQCLATASNSSSSTLRFCTGRTAHRGSRGIALLFHDHGTRRGWGVSVTPPAALYLLERPSTHCTGGWVGPRASVDRCGKSHPSIRSLDRTARSQSLYRLRYPGHSSSSSSGGSINKKEYLCSWVVSIPNLYLGGLWVTTLSQRIM